MRITSKTAAMAAAALVAAATTGGASAAAGTQARAGRPATAVSRAASVSGSCMWQIVPSPSPPIRYTLADPYATVLGSYTTVDAVAPGDVWFPGFDDGDFTPDQPFILHWDGHAVTETSQPPQAPFSAGQDVTAGSFDSASDGWVIGKQYGDYRGLADAAHWSGGRWTITPFDVPSSSSGSLPWVNAVATVSPGSAWAVGALAPDPDIPVTSAGALVEHWDGTQWSIVPNSASATPGTDLQSIKVISPADIWAAGSQGTITAQIAPLIEHYDGTSWHVIPAPPLPATVRPAGLTSISADAPGDIWATGVQQAAGNTGVPLVEHWDGRAWSVVTNLPQTGTGLGFNAGGTAAVYAASPSDVWVAANNNPDPGAFLHWDGQTWTAIPQPAPRENGLIYNLNGIDGTGPGDIWATGFIENFDDSGDQVGSVPQIYHLSC